MILVPNMILSRYIHEESAHTHIHEETECGRACRGRQVDARACLLPVGFLFVLSPNSSRRFKFVSVISLHRCESHVRECVCITITPPAFLAVSFVGPSFLLSLLSFVSQHTSSRCKWISILYRYFVLISLHAPLGRWMHTGGVGAKVGGG
jgi:hypothetical protein